MDGKTLLVVRNQALLEHAPSPWKSDSQLFRAVLASLHSHSLSLSPRPKREADRLEKGEEKKKSEKMNERRITTTTKKWAAERNITNAVDYINLVEAGGKKAFSLSYTLPAIY